MLLKEMKRLGVSLTLGLVGIRGLIQFSCEGYPTMFGRRKAFLNLVLLLKLIVCDDSKKSSVLARRCIMQV